jgi:hypothetical protein
MTDLETCFNGFERTAARLETLSSYAIPAEDERFAAFRECRAIPDRSVCTSPWLRRMAVTTATGKTWSRVRVTELPLTTYEKYEITVAYVESAVAGERIQIAERTAGLSGLGRDFWLFDAGTSGAAAALLYYDDNCAYTHSVVTADPAVITACEADLRLAETAAIPLNAFLAQLRERTEAA